MADNNRAPLIEVKDLKEYFNISLADTLRSWSMMEIIVSVVGIGGVMALNLILH